MVRTNYFDPSTRLLSSQKWIKVSFSYSEVGHFQTQKWITIHFCCDFGCTKGCTMICYLIYFETSSDVEKALDEMDGTEIMGKRVQVSKSTNVSNTNFQRKNDSFPI